MLDSNLLFSGGHGLGHALILAAVLSGVPILAAALAGVTAAVFQAATQVQEQALTFAVKLSAVGAVISFAGLRGLDEVAGFFRSAIDAVARFS